MDSTRIQPVGGHHAIEVMAIGVEWVMPPLDDTQISSLLAVYEGNDSIKKFLPTVAQVQSFVIENQIGVAGPDGRMQFSSQSGPPPQFTARNGGFDLQRFDAEGKITWAASIRPEFISVNCTDYDRWKNVKLQALSILQLFVDSATAKGAKISAIGLQYQDAFRLLDAPSPATTAELFRKDGKFLPLHLFDQPSYWHCHQGWFSNSLDDRRVLNNVATEVAEVNSANFARIGGQHRLFATSVDGKTPKPILSGEIDQILQCLHDENIAVINGILSDDALKKIGCTASGK